LNIYDLLNSNLFGIWDLALGIYNKMRFFVFLLLLAAFLQTAFLPLNLCLLLLIVRSYATEEKENYYLAFASGIFLAILSTHNLGFWTLIFLITVKLVHVVRKFPLTTKGVSIIPVVFFFLLVASFLEQLFFNVSFSLMPLLLGAIISLPIYIAVKMWEDRFIVKPDIKLKI
jgi:hypothetical protein